MRVGQRAWLALALALPVGVSGCILEVDPDPLGTDASVEGSWTIGGAAPTAASCAANGITHVRVRVFDGAVPSDPPSLVFSCADGSFDTRPSAVLRDGIWTLQLIAVNADAPAGEAEVSVGPMMSFDTLESGGHIVIPTADFMGTPAGTTLQGSWTINGAAPTAASCGELGIDEVLVDIEDGPGGARTLKFMCADGGFSEAVDPGSYQIRIVASNLTTGEIAATELTESFTLPEGETYVVNGGSPIDYVGGFDPLGTDSAFTATWKIGGQSVVPPASEDPEEPWACDAVGGAEVDFVFYPSEDLARETEGVVVHMGAACRDGAYASASPVLAEGSYLVSAELYDDGDSLISRHDLESPVTVTAGTDLPLEFDFPLDSPTVHAFFEWEDPDNPGSYTDCTTATVDEMHWELYRDDGTSTGVFVAGQDVGMNVTCNGFANVMGDASGGELMAGNYELVLGGYKSGSKSWQPMSVCTMSIDGDHGLGLAICRAEYNP